MKGKDTNNIILSGGVVDLDRYIDESVITIDRDTTVNAINLHNNMDLKFLVKTGVALTINMFDYAVDLKNKLEIELDNNASFTLNNAFIAEEKYELDIDIKLYGDNVFSKVDIRGINEEKGSIKIVMNGTVAGETHGSEINEYARIINKSEQSSVLIPNLVVNTSEVVANHGISISELDPEALFYLQSKGLEAYHATKILEEGFLLSIMDGEIKEKIKNILIGR